MIRILLGLLVALAMQTASFAQLNFNTANDDHLFSTATDAESLEVSFDTASTLDAACDEACCCTGEEDCSCAFCTCDPTFVVQRGVFLRRSSCAGGQCQQQVAHQSGFSTFPEEKQAPVQAPEKQAPQVQAPMVQAPTKHVHVQAPVQACMTSVTTTTYAESYGAAGGLFRGGLIARGIERRQSRRASRQSARSARAATYSAFGC